MAEAPDPTFDARFLPDEEFDVLALTGDLDMSAVGPFGVVIELLRPFTRPVVVDLADVELLDSSGLHLLIKLRACVVDGGQTLRVRDPSPTARRVFEITDTAALLGLEPVVASLSGAQTGDGELEPDPAA